MENIDNGLVWLKIPQMLQFIRPICLPKLKSSGFQWKKASLGVRSLCIVWLSDLTLSSGISISTFHYVYLALCSYGK